MRISQAFNELLNLFRKDGLGRQGKVGCFALNRTVLRVRGPGGTRGFNLITLISW